MGRRAMYTVYFAGELFDQKHITGNLMLARAIENVSQGKYRCVLPQDWEGKVHSTSAMIRNRDIESVIRADLTLFNFDGPDIDSGTVVEFVIAKMVDVPAVILRTDCRNGAYLFGDDWNLMMSSYPRSYTVSWNALVGYQDVDRDISKMHLLLAQNIIAGFEKVASERPLLQTAEELVDAYQHVVKMCGAGLDVILSAAVLQEIAQEKIQKLVFFEVVNKQIDMISATE